MKTEELKTQFASSLPDDINPDLERAACKLFAEQLESVQRFWKSRPLEKRVTFKFAHDGLVDTMQTETNVYASLCFHLWGARTLDWGWGFGDVLIATNEDTVQFDQNGLAYLPELFKYFEDAFGTMTPDIPDASNIDGELANQWANYFAYALSYSDSPELTGEQPVHTKSSPEAREIIGRKAALLILPTL